jgi:hypothetical protein
MPAIPRLLLLLGGILLAPLASAHAQDPAAGEPAIRQVVEDAYVTAVFVTRDEQAVREGFHPDFQLSVYEEDRIVLVPLEFWLERLALDGQPSGSTVRHEFERVDVTDGAATVKLQLWIDGEHVYTDYLGLYRFNDGWKIVNKIFASQN